MKTLDVAIVDYGMGNILSVQRGLEHCGASVIVTADHEVILNSARVVLPGVGAFANGMAELCSNGLDDVIREVAAKGIPMLGICLGMQMLLDESEEFGNTKGLGLISGKVVSIPSTTQNNEAQKIPHIGWNELILSQSHNNWENTLLSELTTDSAAYFVHSYMAVPENLEHRIADCLYGGLRIPAVIGRENIYGCQFHPEKSGEVGLKILKRFCAD